MGGNDNTIKKSDSNCYTSIGGLQICTPKEEPTTIPVDLNKTLKAGREKALAYKPKWAPYKPKGPGALFGDGSDYKKGLAKKDPKPVPAPVKHDAPKVAAAPKKVAPKKDVTDSGIIKVDLSKYLKPGVDKALAYKPKWGTHKPKAPTAFFPDAVAFAKRPTAQKGTTTATTGMRPKGKGPYVQRGLFITPSLSMNKHPGQYDLGHNFDLRNPRQLAELKEMKAGAKDYESSMKTVRVTYVEGGKVKTETLPLLFIDDRHLNPKASK